ncbi:MAG TPA: hypothetical protein PLY87_01595 [Planctomycetaceae bacterium]|nr:hypothetical protein [Planctomycetaceae bacterium]
MTENTQHTRLEIEVGRNKDDPENPKLKPRGGCVGPYSGHAPTKYGQRSPAIVGKGEVTRAVEEIEPEVRNIRILNPLTNEALLIQSILFTRDPDDWDQDIAECVPLLRQLLAIDRILQNSLADQRQIKAIEQMLIEHPVIGASFRALLEE